MMETPAIYNGEAVDAETVAIELLEAATGNTPANVLDNPYTGIAQAPFSPEAAEILMATIPDSDIEIRPDGLIYLPEIKYRRILNKAFGPGAWSLLPKEIMVGNGDNMMYYRGQLFVHGRFVSEAIGEQQYYPSNDRMSYATAAESAKSNCLVRCCKDLGIAGDLWDPSFVRDWIEQYAIGVWCENIGSNPKDKGKSKKMWRKKDAPPIDVFPWREQGAQARTAAPGAKQQATHQLPPKQEQRPSPDFRQSIVDDPLGVGDDSIAEMAAEKPEVYPGGCTVNQIKRLQTIATATGWKPAEVKRLLKNTWGYASSKEITPDNYDQICADLESKVLLNEVRAAIAETAGEVAS